MIWMRSWRCRPGPFLYGDDKETREIEHRYWIAKYPVTNAQYARFIADEGYHHPRSCGARRAGPGVRRKE